MRWRQWWHRAWGPCLLGHEVPKLYERDDTGALLFVCPRCRQTWPILASRVVRGPKAKPDAVGGAPACRVRRWRLRRVR